MMHQKHISSPNSRSYFERAADRYPPTAWCPRGGSGKVGLRLQLHVSGLQSVCCCCLTDCVETVSTVKRLQAEFTRNGPAYLEAVNSQRVTVIGTSKIAKGVQSRFRRPFSLY